MIKLEKQGFLVVPSIRDVKYLKYTLESECREVLLSNAHIGNLKQLTENCHRNGQKVIVNHELIGGLGNDRIAFEMLKKLYKVDGEQDKAARVDDEQQSSCWSFYFLQSCY